MIGLVSGVFLDPIRVELRQGGLVGGRVYAGASDTTLDPGVTEPLGGSDTLGTTDGKTILLRFADLRRFVGDGPITAASIRLVGSLEGASVKRIARVSAPWGEGPSDTIGGLFRRPSEDGKDTTPVPDAATWRLRQGKRADWQGVGASGPADATPVAGVTVVAADGGATVEGLGPLVQRFRDRPEANFGLLIEFDRPVGFASAQAEPADRPTLVVESTPVAATPGLSVDSLIPENGGWTAVVRNRGVGPMAGLKAIWSRDGRAVAESAVPDLAPGASATVTVKGFATADPTDERRDAIALRIDSPRPDATLADDVLIGYPGGTALPVDRLTAEGFNESWAPSSRASFAPEGILRRVNVAPSGTPLPKEDFGAVARALGAPDVRPLSTAPYLDPFAGPNGGDARYEGTVPPSVAMAAAPAGPMGPRPTGLYSLTDIAFLNGRGTVRQARSALVKIADGRGVPLPRQTVVMRKFDAEGKPVGEPKTLITDNAGTIALPADPKATEWAAATAIGAPMTTFTVTPDPAGPGGEPTVRALKAWELVDAAARSRLPVAIVELRFEIPVVPIDRTTDLADGRLVTDKSGRLPTELAGLTAASGKPIEWTFADGDWIEVDLGRDRTVAEIELEVTGSGAFDVVGYGTGDRPEDAVTAARISDLALLLRNRPGSLKWYPAPRRTRYVRLVGRGAGSVTLTRLRVRPMRTLG